MQHYSKQVLSDVLVSVHFPTSFYLSVKLTITPLSALFLEPVLPNLYSPVLVVILQLSQQNLRPLDASMSTPSPASKRFCSYLELVQFLFQWVSKQVLLGIWYQFVGTGHPLLLKELREFRFLPCSNLQSMSHRKNCKMFQVWPNSAATDSCRPLRPHVLGLSIAVALTVIKCYNVHT